jgi:vacuolar-type H+-ATPase subunit I/STV1
MEPPHNGPFIRVNFKPRPCHSKRKIKKEDIKMQTKNLIQMQANVVKVTALKVGDVVKILEKEYSETYKTVYGVVTEMLNNGKESFITILKYTKDYSSVKATIQTYSGTTDLNLFPASPEEVKNELEASIQYISEQIEKKQSEIDNEKDALSKAISFVSGETAKKLTSASFKEVTQSEYENSVKKLQEQF